jgi:hypothetical protein
MLQARAREAAAAAAGRGEWSGRAGGGADGDKHDEANSQKKGKVTRFRGGREVKILKSLRPSTFIHCILTFFFENRGFWDGGMRSEGCRVCSLTLPDALIVKVLYMVVT